MTARGLRNKNPGNIRHNANIRWRGELDPDADGYARFGTDHDGLRACALDVLTKWRRGLNTVRKIIEVYAPPTENDTASYITAVCSALAVKPDDPLTLENPGSLAVFVKAIVRHENGSVPYTVDDLVSAARDALGIPFGGGTLA